MSWECRCKGAVERGREAQPGSHIYCPFCGRRRGHERPRVSVAVMVMLETLTEAIEYAIEEGCDLVDALESMPEDTQEQLARSVQDSSFLEDLLDRLTKATGKQRMTLQVCRKVKLEPEAVGQLAHIVGDIIEKAESTVDFGEFTEKGSSAEKSYTITQEQMMELQRSFVEVMKGPLLDEYFQNWPELKKYATDIESPST